MKSACQIVTENRPKMNQSAPIDAHAKARAEKEEPWTPDTTPEDAEMLLLSPNIGRECDGTETSRTSGGLR